MSFDFLSHLELDIIWKVYDYVIWINTGHNRNLNRILYMDAFYQKICFYASMVNIILLLV